MLQLTQTLELVEQISITICPINSSAIFDEKSMPSNQVQLQISIQEILITFWFRNICTEDRFQNFI
uniref:Uncharacterized protein n=1 Tax=Rhizophora mucronata TaxID=61149 RepID=A0A2P2QEE3_RHIMU